MSKTPIPIEPGILRIFRWYVGIRLALLFLVALANRGDSPPDPPQFPATGLILFGLLFILLMWSAGERKRWYLPAAIVLATLAPIADAIANIAGRLDAGLAPNDTLVDYWLPFFLLFVPFIITAWQYRYRWVVVFAAFSTIAEMVALTAVFGEEETELAVLGALLAARGLLFAFLGFFVSKLVARQRDLRVELQNQAVTREQIATGRERNRLARELHDTLAHSMTATAIQLEAAEALWDEDPDGARQHVEKALAGTRSGLSEARRAIEDLRASPLEDLGLAGALDWLASDVSATSGVAVTSNVNVGDAIVVEPDVEQAIFRTAAEAVANAVRHASATTVTVRLSVDGEAARLEVTDDGTGFDTSSNRDGHHGITGMKERAGLVGGDLDIESSRAGTVVSLTVAHR